MKLALKTISELEETDERWQADLKQRLYLENRGFGGDRDIPLLGLDTIEDELTTQDAERNHRLGIVDERYRYRGMPMSMCTPDERRRARENDIDDMAHAAWDNEGDL
jgi:hypothetical protein